MSTGGATDYVGLFRPSGALPQNAAQLQFSMVCERPLPPSAALPLTEGENKASLPREGETRAKRARGSLTHHLELKLSNRPLQPARARAQAICYRIRAIDV